MWIAVTVLVLAGANPEVQRLPGSRELARWCKAPVNTDPAIRCIDYIYAVANEVDRARIGRGLPQCIPPSIDSERLRKTITRALVTDPRAGASTGPATLVAITLIEAFDCTSDPQGKGTPHRLPGPLVPF